MSPMKLMDRLFDQDGIVMYAQPVVCVEKSSAEVAALEFLARGPSHSNLQSPAILFEYVRQKRAELAVDEHCIRLSMKSAQALEPSVRININVHSATIIRDAQLNQFMKECAHQTEIDLSRITLEIECLPTEQLPELATMLRPLRELGIEIAMNGGGGLMNLRMILECRPEFIKIDPCVVKGCGSDGIRRAMLKGVVDIADKCNSRVIATGIESIEDLATAEATGIHMVEGYLFGEPALPNEALANARTIAKSWLQHA
jgi:EAL domain-containing protein (putative c-di-GMP-specific phosphodiesterase class I)